MTLFWAARGSIAESRWAGIVESSPILGSDAAQCDLCLPDSRIRPQHAVSGRAGRSLAGAAPWPLIRRCLSTVRRSPGTLGLQNNDTLRLGRTTIRLVL